MGNKRDRYNPSSGKMLKTEDPDKSALFFDGAGVGVDKGLDPKKKSVVINANSTETTIRWICDGNKRYKWNYSFSHKVGSKDRRRIRECSIEYKL